MNKIVLLIILFSLECYTQNKLLDILPLKDGKVNYISVLEVDGVSKEELYNRANYWLMNSEDYQNAIISTDDKNEQITGKGSFKELWGPNDYPELYVDVLQTFRFQFRNGRYQYSITNFIVKKPGMETQLEIYKMKNKKFIKYNKSFYKRIDTQIKKIINSLEKTMTMNTSVAK